MTCRSYTLRNGTPIEVETDPNVTIEQVQTEVCKLYGPAFQVCRWGRRGNRWRAAVVRKDEQYPRYHATRESGMSAGGWFEVAP